MHALKKKSFRKLLLPFGGKVFLFLALIGFCFGTFAQPVWALPDSQSMDANLVEYISMDPDNCHMTNTGYACFYTIIYHLDWSKDSSYPYSSPCPDGCWASLVWRVSDSTTPTTIGFPDDYSGVVHLKTLYLWLTDEELQNLRASFYNDHWRVFSYFVTPSGEQITITSNAGLAFLDMSDDIEDEDFQPRPQNNPACSGDPVYLHSGQFFYQCDDLEIPGRWTYPDLVDSI